MHPPISEFLFSGRSLVVLAVGGSVLPFPCRAAVGAVCQIPGLALLGRGAVLRARGLIKD